MSQSEKRIIFSQSETFIFRVDEVELGNIRNYYYRIFPSGNSRHFEMFDLEKKNRENRETTREKEILDQSEGLILKSRIELELSK